LARREILLKAPVAGRSLAMDQVPDPVFAERIMGDGVAFEPSGSEVRAPVSGRVEVLFPTGHAVGIRTREGVEVLIHIGLETANLQGIFTPATSVGAPVHAGDLLVRFDLEALRSQAASPVIPMVVTSLPDGYTLEVLPVGKDVRPGETVAKISGPGAERGLFSWLRR